jgi:hypothetical protein
MSSEVYGLARLVEEINQYFEEVLLATTKGVMSEMVIAPFKP